MPVSWLIKPKHTMDIKAKHMIHVIFAVNVNFTELKY